MTTIADRAAEILAGWDAEDAAAKVRRDAHAEWVAYMKDVARIRPETLPCVHGTAMWPDRGQVCGACEAESSYDDEDSPEVRAAAALAQAEREAARAAEPDPSATPDYWADCPF